MSLSEEGEQLARELLKTAGELGIDLNQTNPVQMRPLFDLIPEKLRKLALDQMPAGGNEDAYQALFIQILISQLPERETPMYTMPQWRRKAT